MSLLDDFWQWIQDALRGRSARPLSLEERVEDLTLDWGITLQMTWHIVRRYAALHSVSLPEAVDGLKLLTYREARREIGER